MSVLKRYTQPVDGTIPAPALLYEDEDLLASQDGVGIYSGTQKSPNHQLGVICATTHRLLYIDAVHARSRSFSLDLSLVDRTEHYAGLLRSSAKVTLYLNALSPRSGQATTSNRTTTADLPAEGSWECGVCGFRNPPGLSPAASKVCSLCGVPRASAPSISVPVARPSNSLSQFGDMQHLSLSLPSSSANLRSFSSPSSPQSQTIVEVACPACTFLNHPSLRECEICGTALPRPHSTAKSAPASRPGSDDEDDDEPYPENEDGPRMIRVSFRKGGDKAFYAVLRRSLLGKGWEASITNTGQRSAARDASSATASSSAGRSGINGILQNVATNVSTSQSHMEDALQDLEALMVKAREMVKLAEDLNERLSAVSTTNSGTATPTSVGSGAVEPEEATFIRSSLAQLGLQISNAPVTLDMIRDERKWTEELAKELANVLQGQGGKNEGGALMNRRGIVGLDEVWGGWNRARGVALIPPSTFLLVLPHLPTYTTPPIHRRTFESGLTVLHTPPYSKAAFAARMVGLIGLAGPKTTVEVAQDEQIPIGLAQEMIAEVEDAGEICRDDNSDGIGPFNARSETRWWVNVFKEYAWDGQVEQ